MYAVYLISNFTNIHYFCAKYNNVLKELAGNFKFILLYSLSVLVFFIVISTEEEPL